MIPAPLSKEEIDDIEEFYVNKNDHKFVPSMNY